MEDRPRSRHHVDHVRAVCGEPKIAVGAPDDSVRVGAERQRGLGDLPSRCDLADEVAAGAPVREPDVAVRSSGDPLHAGPENASICRAGDWVLIENSVGCQFADCS